MVNNMGKEQLANVNEIKMGTMGTRMWERGEIAWAANSGLMIVCTGAIIAGVKHFEFILVPLLTSYFLVFLVAPIMDSFMHRPMVCKYVVHINHPRLLC